MDLQGVNLGALHVHVLLFWLRHIHEGEIRCFFEEHLVGRLAGSRPTMSLEVVQDGSAAFADIESAALPILQAISCPGQGP
jgi:hypothetical protein